MDRQQLDRRHAQILEIVECRLRRQPGVGPAQILSDFGVALGEALTWVS